MLHVCDLPFVLRQDGDKIRECVRSGCDYDYRDGNDCRCDKLSRCIFLFWQGTLIWWFNINLLFSRLGMEIFQPNCWGNYSDLLERIPVTPRSRCEKEVLKLFTNFLIFLVSCDVCLGPVDCPCPSQLIMRIFCRSVQCVFLWQDLMNEVDTASVGSFNFPNFLNMMLRLQSHKMLSI